MPKIVDPDELNQGIEVVFSAAKKTIQLIIAGNLDDNSPGKDSGVTGRAVYSFCKEEWVVDDALNRFRFPINMIYEASFILINGWAWEDAQTRDLVRDAGFREELLDDEYSCIISLGDMDAPLVDQPYYANIFGYDQSTILFDKTGELNENIQVFDGAADNRGYLVNYLREYNKLYAEYDLITEQGLSNLTYQAYRLPLGNNIIDSKIIDNDAVVDAGGAYAMSISFVNGQLYATASVIAYVIGDVIQDGIGRWAFCTVAGTLDAAGAADYTNNGGTSTFVQYVGEVQIGTNFYAFNVVINGNGQLKELIHTYAQRRLRLVTDINDNSLDSAGPQGGYGTVNGSVSKILSLFVGDQLETEPGIAFINFDANDTNSITQWDITVDGGGLDIKDSPLTTTGRVYPFVGAGTLSFSQNLVDEPDIDTRYTMYFKYISETINSTIAVTATAGSDADITWSSTALDHIVPGDHLSITGFTDPSLNSVWLVNTVGGNTLNATLINSNTPISEAAGNLVTVLENSFESPTSIVVNDNSGTPINGQITALTIPFDFDYDGNNQSNRIPGTDTPVIVVFQALDGAQWNEAQHTITRSTGQNIICTAVDELNYSNPV